MTGTCAGSFVPGTLYVPEYDPNAPVYRGRQNAELATVCVANSLTSKKRSPPPITIVAV